jgi:hypothetical protein
VAPAQLKLARRTPDLTRPKSNKAHGRVALSTWAIVERARPLSGPSPVVREGAGSVGTLVAWFLGHI